MIDGRSSTRGTQVRVMEDGRPVWAMGMMSGTSMDGLDLAFMSTDGHRIDQFGPSWSMAHWPGLRTEIEAALGKVAELPTEALRNRDTWPDFLRELEHRVSLQTGWAIEGFQRDEGMDAPGRDSLWAQLRNEGLPVPMGIHGQTILHRPDERFTLQLFDPNQLSAGLVATEIVSDFRSADLKAGGEGAPLAPFFHFALAKHIGADTPLAFLNIGGVGNVTWIDPSKDLPEDPGALLAFDTGPGNALVNDWMQRQIGEAMDRDGAAASQGKVHRERLSSNAARAYLDRVPPKSLDRNDFTAVLAAMEDLLVEDGAATLTAFTVDCVAESLNHMPSPPSRWLACGGGRRNATMMRMLDDRLDAPVDPVEAVGLDGDMLEAQAFAFLAVRVLRGLPTSAPSTTGCREPICGGTIWSA